MSVTLGQITEVMKTEKAKLKKYDTEEEESPRVAEPDAVYHTNGSYSTVAILGMQSNKLFDNITSDNDYIQLIREGVPKAAMTNLMSKTGITTLEMASITHTSDRTLRRYTDQDKLPQEQSERVIELARLYSKGSEVFGTLDAFKEWMDATLMPLGYKKPKEFLDTSIGIDLLLKEIGRIEHGIFA